VILHSLRKWEPEALGFRDPFFVMAPVVPHAYFDNWMETYPKLHMESSLLEEVLITVSLHKNFVHQPDDFCSIPMTVH
jgi:hypothetical protein